MKKSGPTYEELLEHLEGERFLGPEEAGVLRTRIGEVKAAPGEPLYIRILIGLGAWFAAIFFILFLIVAELLRSETAAIAWGVIFLGGGVLIHLKTKATFITQLSLALAFSGNVMVLVGVAAEYSGAEYLAPVLVQALICAVVYPFYANVIYRFVSPTALAVLLTAWIIHEKIHVFMHPLLMAQALLAGFLILRKKQSVFFDPLKYSAATMLPATLLFLNMTQMDIWRHNFDEPLWPSSVFLSLSLVYLFFHLSGGREKMKEPWMILAIIATFLMGGITTPGILVALGLLVAGFAFGDRFLTGLSYLFFPCFLFVFYYALNIDLAYKSWVLGGSGLILLIVRHIAWLVRPKELKG